MHDRCLNEGIEVGAGQKLQPVLKELLKMLRSRRDVDGVLDA